MLFLCRSDKLVQYKYTPKSEPLPESNDGGGERFGPAESCARCGGVGVGIVAFVGIAFVGVAAAAAADYYDAAAAAAAAAAAVLLLL